MLPVNPKFYKYPKNSVTVVSPSAAKVRLIERTTFLSVPEKVNILAMFCRHKWVTDVAIGLRNRKEVEDVLDKLGLPYGYNFYEFDNVKYEWLQVTASKALLDYVLSRRDELTVLEAGVLYGYPASHSLGYLDLIPRKIIGDKSIAEFYLSGIFSEPGFEKEQQYFETVWNEIKALSPTIAKQALDFYDKSIDENRFK